MLNRIGSKPKSSSLSLPIFNAVLEETAVQLHKRREDTKMWKEERKQSLFTDGKILYSQTSENQLVEKWSQAITS